MLGVPIPAKISGIVDRGGMCFAEQQTNFDRTVTTTNGTGSPATNKLWLHGRTGAYGHNRPCANISGFSNAPDVWCFQLQSLIILAFHI